MLQRREVLHPALYSTTKGEDVGTTGYMTSTGDRLGEWEKAKWGNLWGWMKSEMIDTCFFYMSRYRTANVQQLTH